jgi:hypothetical protein
LVVPVLLVGLALLALGIWLRLRIGDHWYVLLLKEAGAVLMVVAVIHTIYELVIHKVLRGDIEQLGVSVETLQRTVAIVGGAVEAGLSAVYSSREDVNRAMINEIDRMRPGSTLRLLGISLGAFLCPHGALHGVFRKLLTRDDIKVEALILDTESLTAVERARLEEPRSFFHTATQEEERNAYVTTRCHNELKTATDFAEDISVRCYYRDQGNGDPKAQIEDAPNEPSVNAKFWYGIYQAPPLCYLVIFEDCMFLESYHYAGRGGESPVLEIKRHSGKSRETTSLFRIYENHFRVMRRLSRDRSVRQTAG